VTESEEHQAWEEPRGIARAQGRGREGCPKTSLRTDEKIWGLAYEEFFMNMQRKE
jgi:hypothetical protein